MSRGMARPAMGVRWGGEACAAAEPSAGKRLQLGSGEVAMEEAGVSRLEQRVYGSLGFRMLKRRRWEGEP